MPEALAAYATWRFCRRNLSKRTLRWQGRQSLVVESRMGAVAWAMRQRSVFHPRSSNRTCGFPASGSPTGFTVRHTKQITDVAIVAFVVSVLTLDASFTADQRTAPFLLSGTYP